MIAQDNILVVVDSAHSEHLALDRAVKFAGRQRHSAMTVHVLVGYEGHDLSDPDHPVEVTRGRDWLSGLLAPLEETGIEFEVRLLWTLDWEKSIIDTARQTGADVILITQSSAINKKGITDSSWSLLRNSEVPVLTVEPGAPARRENILAAVNMQTMDEEYEALNRKVLLQGQALAEFYDAKLHVVNAYQDSEDYPDRDNVKRVVDLARKDIHVDMGKPEVVIATVADSVQADLVIIGTMSRRGVRATLRRNTSEKIIEQLVVDVLTLN